MKHLALAFSVSWYGLFVGVEQTAPWRNPFHQPGVSATAVAVFGVGRTNVRAVYIQPLQPDGFGPAVQFGVSFRVF